MAPSPTGLLHLGHARTFWIASSRARAAGGSLLLRNDDLDHARCQPAFVAAMQEDLLWLGLTWDRAMVSQSDRFDRYRQALERLHAAGRIFPCTRSRRDVIEAAGAPHEGGADDEPLYPREFRPKADAPLPPYLQRANWEVMKDRIDRLEVTRANMVDWIGGREEARPLVTVMENHLADGASTRTTMSPPSPCWIELAMSSLTMRSRSSTTSAPAANRRSSPLTNSRAWRALAGDEGSVRATCAEDCIMKVLRRAG